VLRAGNLSSGRMVERGSGRVIAAIYWGTRYLTPVRFHGWYCSNIAADAAIRAKFNGVVEFEDVRTIETTNNEGTWCGNGSFRRGKNCELGTDKILILSTFSWIFLNR